MTGRALGGGFGRSPLEVAGIVVGLGLMVGLGIVWGAGVLIGSILGSTLPGTNGEGVVAMLRSFPDLGQAWIPPIPSWLVWAGAAVVMAVFGPLVWRLARAGRLAEEGAQWATTVDLWRAGLLVSDHTLPHAQPEEPVDEA